MVANMGGRSRQSVVWGARPSSIDWGRHAADESMMAKSAVTYVGLPTWAVAAIAATGALIFILGWWAGLTQAEAMESCQLLHSFATCHAALVG